MGSVPQRNTQVRKLSSVELPDSITLQLLLLLLLLLPEFPMLMLSCVHIYRRGRKQSGAGRRRGCS